MSNFFIICMILAMISVLAVLATGIVSMIRGGEFNKKYGNRLMQLRVILQAATLALLALAYMSSQT